MAEQFELVKETSNPGEVNEAPLAAADDHLAVFVKDSNEIDELISITETLGSVHGALGASAQTGSITEATAKTLGACLLEKRQ